MAEYILDLSQYTEDELRRLCRTEKIISTEEFAAELQRRSRNWLGGKSSTWTDDDSRRVADYVATKVDL